MLNHVVLMKFKPEISDGDIRELEKALDDLPNRIRDIKMYEFGRNTIPSDRSYDFALIALFANPEALERYLRHPDHLPVAAMVKSMCASVATVDFSGSDAGAAEAGLPEWERDPWESLKR